MNKKNEQWKDVERVYGFQVSNLGRVRGFKSLDATLYKARRFHKLITPEIDEDGNLYITYEPSKDKKYKIRVDYMVAQEFIPSVKPLKMIHESVFPKYEELEDVIHINGDKRDCSIENLKWK